LTSEIDLATSNVTIAVRPGLSRLGRKKCRLKRREKEHETAASFPHSPHYRAGHDPEIRSHELTPELVFEAVAVNDRRAQQRQFDSLI
jgi:hypothetical protein